MTSVTCHLLLLTLAMASVFFGVRRVEASSPANPGGADSLERETMYGRVRGTMRTLHFLGGRQVERYLGVPYASPPVGDLRFEFPKPPESWEGVRDCSSMPKACPQTNWELNYVRMHVPEFKSSDMDEDCLYLNIYVPVTTSQGFTDGGGLPVLIHVHGGSNEVGMGALFEGDTLASLGEIIVISFNYRLGAFGFLSGESPDLPGNYGLHDQTEAFRWVSKNIHFFGGDPAKVTIQGHSAGGTDVGQHVVSPHSKGLFRYAIMQSGSPLAYWAMVLPPISTLSATRHFVKDLGCVLTSNMAAVKACLKQLSWRAINDETYMHVRGIYNFSPLVDDHFILAAPEEALLTLPLNGEAFMTGITRDEGSLTAELILQMAETDNRQFRFEEDYPKDYTPPPVHAFNTVPGIGSLVYHEYKPFDDPFNKTANLIGVSHVVGDSTFVAPAVKLAKLMSRRSDDVYLYTFNHVSRLSSTPQWMGVPHGRDLFYLFGCPLSSHPLHKYTQLDKNVSRAFIDFWSNFVKHGRPSLSSDPDLEFTTFEERNQSYVIVASDGHDADIHSARRLRPRQVAFWNNLLPKLRKKDSKIPESTEKTLTWVFVALTSVLLVVVVILLVCVFYFKKLAHDRCVVHANDEKNKCRYSDLEA
ncbi:pyrethroid hydrolase Ces2e-like [Littorina saxatilis]|uniref:pyrethroid hydrolase Ces2e-like n=1 Tax=Littorina saxatilis TaxID=31220 RepID=UPI0038B493CA